MIDFIKENMKISDLYIDIITVNKIIQDFKEELQNNKEQLLKLYKIDTKNCKQIMNLNTILELLESYKNESIINGNKKKAIIASYYGSPYITINLCIQSMLQKKIIIAITHDSMVGTNKLLIDIFNNILEKYRIARIIEVFNLVKPEEIKNVNDYLDNIICIGNTNAYYEYERYGIEKLKYIPFKNMAIYCDEEEYMEVQTNLYNYAVVNGIEAEIYEDDIEEFVECVKLDDKLENIVILSKSETLLKKVKDDIKNCNVYINKNPFKKENYKINIT